MGGGEVGGVGRRSREEKEVEIGKLRGSEGERWRGRETGNGGGGGREGGGRTEGKGENVKSGRVEGG